MPATVKNFHSLAIIMLSSILYYFLWCFFYLLSLLPFRVLYFLSDIVCFILFIVVGYRKEVISTNLKNAFPEKTPKELTVLQNNFYHYFCDLFFETFKTLSISPTKMLLHCNLDESSRNLFEKYAIENKSLILVMGHLGNWEWGGNTFSILFKHQLYVIYHELTNKNFDRLMYNMRTRFGTKLIEMHDTFRTMVGNKREMSATGFIADQTPQPNGAYWTTFLNQDTPVFWGTEKIARKLNYPVIYVCIKRMKRGYYEFSAELLVENPSQTIEGEITELHTKKLEKDIIANPEIWLWSHRRWKHKKPEIT